VEYEEIVVIGWCIYFI